MSRATRPTGEPTHSRGQILHDARILIQERYRIRLELRFVDRFGNEIPILRPAEPAEVPLFAVAVEETAFGVMSSLMPDAYAGNILRLIGESAGSEPELWVRQVAEGTADGIRTSLYVNGDLVKPDCLPTTRWRSWEIEGHGRIPAWADPDNRVEIVAAVAGLCLALCLTGLDTEDFQDPAESAPEGARTTVMANRYERSSRNRRACINHYGWLCWVCDLDFSEIYGPLGDGYIQVHHMVPVAEMGPGYRPDPVKEMVPLCSNCHSMIHRGESLLSPVELRELLGKDPKENLWNGQTPTG